MSLHRDTQTEILTRATEEYNILSLLVETNPKTGKPTGLQGSFKKAITALSGSDIDYVVVGAHARAVYSEPRATKDIDVMAYEEDKEDIRDALESGGFSLIQQMDSHDVFKDNSTGVELDILYPFEAPGTTAIDTAHPKNLYGVPALVVRPKYLLWLYLQRETPQSDADAMALLQSGVLSGGDKLDLYDDMEADGDRDSMKRLQDLIKRMGQTESYSDFIKRRKALRESKT